MSAVVDTCGNCKRAFSVNGGKYCEEHQQPECNWCRFGDGNPKALHPVKLPYDIGDDK